MHRSFLRPVVFYESWLMRGLPHYLRSPCGVFIAPTFGVQLSSQQSRALNECLAGLLPLLPHCLCLRLDAN